MELTREELLFLEVLKRALGQTAPSSMEQNEVEECGAIPLYAYGQELQDISLESVCQITKSQGVYVLCYEELAKLSAGIQAAETEHTTDVTQASGVADVQATGMADVAKNEQDIVTTQGLQQIRQQVLLQYRMFHEVSILCKAFEALHIPVVVMKGMAAARYYDYPELRKSSDMDILLFDASEEALHQAGECLRKMGYAPDRQQHGLHHTAYHNAEGLLLELHTSITQPFEDASINEALIRFYEDAKAHITHVEVVGRVVPVLEDEYQGILLLAHMLQHFMYSGFSMRLISDWKKLCDSMYDRLEDLFAIAKKYGLFRFAKLITDVCTTYLGFDRGVFVGTSIEASSVHPNIDSFVKDILQGGEAGQEEAGRMITLMQPGLNGLLSAFHHQMLHNFPRAKKWVIIWPLLYLYTFILFAYNNIRLGRGSIGGIMRNSIQRAELLKQLDILGE